MPEGAGSENTDRNAGAHTGARCLAQKICAKDAA
jgi:hypothetical protein